MSEELCEKCKGFGLIVIKCKDCDGSGYSDIDNKFIRKDFPLKSTPSLTALFAEFKINNAFKELEEEISVLQNCIKNNNNSDKKN